MTPLLRAVILLAAGGLAGLVGTAGGITTLVAYPALIATGVPALAANVANIVAGTACWPGSALVSGRELRYRGPWLLRHLPVAAIGGGVGAVLLLSTSPDIFKRIVPFLVVAGSCSLLLAPRLTRVDEAGKQMTPWAIDLAIFPISVYGGYFGAGSGVMLLATMLIAVVTELPAANALKNMLVGASVVLAALLLIMFRHIDWQATLPLAAGMLVGSMVGPSVARRLPPNVVRPAVAAIGFGLAIQLWLSHGS
jgi:uncharacterized membrane protein YfcA